jgi:hypothetical protein
MIIWVSFACVPTDGLELYKFCYLRRLFQKKENDKGAELRSKLQLTDEIFVQHESTLPT